MRMPRQFLLVGMLIIWMPLKLQVERLLPTLERKIARASLQRRGASILCLDQAEAIELINRIAPEHLELFRSRRLGELA